MSKLEDFKVLDAKIGYASVKVLVEIKSNWLFDKHIMTIKNNRNDRTETAKGDYRIIRLAFNSFTEKEADEFVERCENKN
jgi:hypothetical protein